MSLATPLGSTIFVLNTIRSAKGSDNPGLYWNVNPLINVLALLLAFVGPRNYYFVGALITFLGIQLWIDRNYNTSDGEKNGVRFDWVSLGLAIGIAGAMIFRM